MENYRDTYANVDLDALRRNIAYIHQIAKKPIMAIVKANAYGHGAVEIAKAASSMDEIQMFGVATLGEGIELRNHGITKEILVIGSSRPEDMMIASQRNISISVYSMDDLEKVLSAHFEKPLKVHIKIDTGMNRIGFKGKADFEEALARLQAHPLIQVEGAFTHYGAAEEENDTYQHQFETFQSIVAGHQFKYLHAANTAGALYHHEDLTNLVRVGIALYGIEPNGSDDTPLEQVMSLYTRVVMTKKICAGEHVGYGFTYQAKQDEYLATVPIGYADGIIRKNQNREVYINGRYYQIVGRICMDQMMIRVDENVQVGNLVEIFGPHISLNRMARELETIPYEIICLLSLRVARHYIQNGICE
ncbi:Alanine racemase [Clostridiales bacterium CHKCI006]|uniref:Alanine racemase n=1 Tax=Candidatus Fimiplasma intestinipullorum TaxID=2840825 RepID=A0A9D1L0Y3_9FIRM|nr:Alanine racemase [Clostridiales bacterium CHKCI006]HIU14230.1 alanine racemase [Candidatus Fimiplasma intestinipullorum]